jgi:hypothetical protein
MSVIGKMSMSIQAVLSDARASAAIGAGTYGISMAQVMGWIQSNIGFIGTLAGIVLTIATLWVQIINGRRQLAGREIDALDKKKRELETELLRRQLDK